MKKVKVFEHDTCGYCVRIKKDISLSKLQKLCQNITSELEDKGYYEPIVNFIINKNNVEITVNLFRVYGDEIGIIGFACKQFDCDADFYEIFPFHSNAFIKEWSEEEWDKFYHNATD